MKKIKKALAILLVVFIVLGPICVIVFNIDISDDENNHRVEKEEEAWRGVIRMWDFPRLDTTTGSRYGWIEDKIKRFEAKNPGVFIELTPIDWNKGPLKLEVGLETGKLPDIAPIGTDFLYMNDKTLEPLDSYFEDSEIKEFKDLAIKAVKNDGKTWGVPFMMTTYGMYINLDLFKEKDIEPPKDGNWTYDEFVEIAKKLTFDSDNDGKIDQYGFHSFIKPNYYNLWGMILSDDGKIVNEKDRSYAFYDKKAVSGVEKIVDLKNKYKVTPEDFGVCNENKAWDMFSKEKKVAIYPAGSWGVKVLENLSKNGEGFDFTVVNYPTGDGGKPTSLNNSISAYGIFKQKDKEKLDTIVKFLKFLVEDETQKELEKLGVFSVKNNIDEMYADNEHMKRIEESLKYTQTIPKHPKWKEIDRILQNQIRLAVIKEKTSKEALEEAKSQIEQILSN